MWESLQKILSLPDDVKVYHCHDYKAGGKRDEFLWTSTIREQRENIQLAQKDESAYKEFRQERDATLAPPRLIHPSLQFNLQAGRPPKPSFVKIPVSGTWH